METYRSYTIEESVPNLSYVFVDLISGIRFSQKNPPTADIQFRGGSRAAAASQIERFVIIVNILDVAAALYPLLQLLLFFKTIIKTTRKLITEYH